MDKTITRFEFGQGADLAEIESTLHLAVLAVEGLHGEARVRLEVRYRIDTPTTSVLLDCQTGSGRAVARVFAAFLTRELGADGFRIRRVTCTRSDGTCGKPRCTSCPRNEGGGVR
ncbi:MAG: hypothetical protein NCW75_11475 [Phycisphaera sp.]|nr:MAG: hypothetical protein NCW75_11475 [Phycisphaera sp.]